MYWIGQSLSIYNLLDPVDAATGRLLPMYSFIFPPSKNEYRMIFTMEHILFAPSRGGCLIADLRNSPRYSPKVPPRKLEFRSFVEGPTPLNLSARGRLVALRRRGRDSSPSPVKLYDLLSRKFLTELPPCTSFQFIDSQRGVANIFGGVYHVEFSPASAANVPRLDIGFISGEIASTDSGTREHERKTARIAVEPGNLNQVILNALGASDMTEVHLISAEVECVFHFDPDGS